MGGGCWGRQAGVGMWTGTTNGVLQFLPKPWYNTGTLPFKLFSGNGDDLKRVFNN